MNKEAITTAVTLPPGVYPTAPIDAFGNDKEVTRTSSIVCHATERFAKHRRLRCAINAKAETMHALTRLLLDGGTAPPLAAEEKEPELRRLRLENERLLAVVRDLRRELSDAGRTLCDQTAALRRVGAQMARLDPHRLVRQRREQEPHTPNNNNNNNNHNHNEAEHDEDEDEELTAAQRVARRGWAAREHDLLQYIALLETQIGRMERRLSPERPSRAALFNLTVGLLSCAGLRNRRNNGLGCIDPFVVIFSPCGERLLETVPREDTDCPRFNPSDDAVHVKAARGSPWGVTLEVFSRSANGGRLFLGQAKIPVGPLLEELTTTHGGSGEVRRTLSLHPREREADATIARHAETLGTVDVYLAARVVGRVAPRRRAVLLSPRRDSLEEEREEEEEEEEVWYRGNRARHGPTQPCRRRQERNKKENVRFLRLAGARGVLKRDVDVKSNPFAVVFRGGIEVMRTSPAVATANPSWESAPLTLRGLHEGSEPIVVRVFDYDSEGVEDFLGEARLSMAQLLATTEWQEVKLCPRPEETLLYIREYENRLGTLLLQCTSEGPSCERRGRVWTRRQPSRKGTASKVEVTSSPGYTDPTSTAEPSEQSVTDRNERTREEKQTRKKENVNETKRQGSIESTCPEKSEVGAPTSSMQTDLKPPTESSLSAETPSISAETAAKPFVDCNLVSEVTTAANIAPTSDAPLPTQEDETSGTHKCNENDHTQVEDSVRKSDADHVSVRVYVKGGADLLDCDEAMFNVLGVTDPRVMVWVGPDHVFTVPEKHDTVNPKWETQEAEFHTVVHANQMFRFDVQDVDVAGFDAMGSAKIHVSEIIKKPGEHTLPVVLHGKQYGTLTVHFTLES